MHGLAPCKAVEQRGLSGTARAEYSRQPTTTSTTTTTTTAVTAAVAVTVPNCTVSADMAPTAHTTQHCLLPAAPPTPPPEEWVPDAAALSELSVDVLFVATSILSFEKVLRALPAPLLEKARGLRRRGL